MQRNRNQGSTSTAVEQGFFDSMENIEDNNEAAIEACQKVNERALAVIEGELAE